MAWGNTSFTIYPYKDTHWEMLIAMHVPDGIMSKSPRGGEPWPVPCVGIFIVYDVPGGWSYLRCATDYCMPQDVEFWHNWPHMLYRGGRGGGGNWHFLKKLCQNPHGTPCPTPITITSNMIGAFSWKRNTDNSFKWLQNKTFINNFVKADSLKTEKLWWKKTQGFQ